MSVSPSIIKDFVSRLTRNSVLGTIMASSHFCIAAMLTLLLNTATMTQSFHVLTFALVGAGSSVEQTGLILTPSTRGTTISSGSPGWRTWILTAYFKLPRLNPVVVGTDARGATGCASLSVLFPERLQCCVACTWTA